MHTGGAPGPVHLLPIPRSLLGPGEHCNDALSSEKKLRKLGPNDIILAVKTQECIQYALQSMSLMTIVISS